MEEGCPIYFYLGRFIWGCLNGENNMKPHSRLKDIHFFFLCGDQNLLWHNYIKNEKEKLLEKAVWIGSYSWYLRPIEVKCV